MAKCKASKEWGLDLGSRIRDRRTMLGLTLSAVATKIGSNWNYLQILETKGGNPSAYMISQLADALETSTDDLLGHCTPNEAPAATPAELIKIISLKMRLLNLVKLMKEVVHAVERECGPTDDLAVRLPEET